MSILSRRLRQVVLGCVFVSAVVGAAHAGQRVQQLAEDGVQTQRLPASEINALIAAPVNRVCEPGAKWIRLGFRELTLGSYDALTLTSSGGDVYVFEGDRWNGRSFHGRAMRGECVDIQTYFGHPDSTYEIESYQFGTQALESTAVVVAGAGDICDSDVEDCAATSDLIVDINPTAVFTAGDNVYDGYLEKFNDYYEPSWGRFKELTSPTPGNHEYYASTVAEGYFDYFNGVGNNTGAAGDRGKGYYSYDVGEWHFVALNTFRNGSSLDLTQDQLDWLESDLAATTKPCIAAYFHHPLVSTGHYTGYSAAKTLTQKLYAAKADLVLVGHDHNYQRFGKINPDKQAASDGFRQILVGTGGRGFYSQENPNSTGSENLERSIFNRFGVLKLTLTADGYSGDFVPVSGSTTDTFSGTCNPKGGTTPPDNTPPSANFNFSTNGLTANFIDNSSDSDGSIASRSWNFGDGSSSTATNPSHTYAANGTYSVTLTVTDDSGATDSETKSVTVSDGSGGGSELQNGVPVSNLSGAQGDEQRWTLAVPTGASNLMFVITGGSGDADLYLKFGSEPTTGSYDCRPYKDGNEEVCTVTSPQAGTYHVMLRGYRAYSDVSLTGSYSEGGGGGEAQTYSNTTDYVINDNSTVESPITISGRTGSAPTNASVTVDIKHTYIRDLIVDLVAPDGSTYNIHDRAGGSADDIYKTVTLDLSSEPLNGTWKLRVSDSEKRDTGYIDGWSITF